jgi:hypothetical protein
MGFVPSHVKMFGDPPGGQGVGEAASLVASVTGGSICMLLPAKAGTDAIPKGKINAANISPWAVLAAVRSCVAEFVIRIFSSLQEFYV